LTKNAALDISVKKVTTAATTAAATTTATTSTATHRSKIGNCRTTSKMSFWL